MHSTDVRNRCKRHPSGSIEPREPAAGSSLELQGAGKTRLTLFFVVMADPTLSAISKAIYAFLCSLQACEPASWSVSQILKSLHIGENCFYRHRKLLIERGLISVEQPEIYEHSVYTISKTCEEVYGDIAGGQVSLTQALDIARGWVADHELIGEEDRVDGVRVSVVVSPQVGIDEPIEANIPLEVVHDYSEAPRNEIKPDDPRLIPTPPYPPLPRPADRVGWNAYDGEFTALAGRSLSGKDDIVQAQARYLRLIDRGWAPETIAKAYELYREDHLKSHRGPAKAMHLETFLVKGSGIGYWGGMVQVLEDEQRDDSAAPKASRGESLAIPTRDEVAAYIKRCSFNVDADDFYDYYQSTGWRNAHGVPVADWKAKAASWARRAERKAVDDAPRVPLAEEASEYARQHGLKVDVGRFMSYWTSRGWRFAGGAPVKDWAAALESFAKNEVKQKVRRAASKATGPAEVPSGMTYLEMQRARAEQYGLHLTDEELEKPGNVDYLILKATVSPEIRRGMEETEKMARDAEASTRAFIERRGREMAAERRARGEGDER